MAFGRNPRRADPDVALVGRVDEMRALTDAIDHLQEGTGRTVFVAGEAGIGKSRLLAEARRYAALANVAWIQGQCDALEVGAPFAGIRDLIRSAPSSVVVEGEAGAILRRLVGGERGPDDLERMPDATRFSALAAVAAFATEAARAGPVVLCLEDLHWSDPSTLDALRRLRDVARSTRVLVVATLRIVRGHESQVLIAGSEAEPAQIVLRLGPLAEDEERRLLHELSGGTLTAESEEAVLSASDGVPLYLREFVRSVQEHRSGRGTGTRRSSHARTLDPCPTGSSVSEGAGGRIRTLRRGEHRRSRDRTRDGAGRRSRSRAPRVGAAGSDGHLGHELLVLTRARSRGCVLHAPARASKGAAPACGAGARDLPQGVLRCDARTSLGAGGAIRASHPVPPGGRRRGRGRLRIGRGAGARGRRHPAHARARCRNRRRRARASPGDPPPAYRERGRRPGGRGTSAGRGAETGAIDDWSCGASRSSASSSPGPSTTGPRPRCSMKRSTSPRYSGDPTGLVSCHARLSLAWTNRLRFDRGLEHAERALAIAQGGPVARTRGGGTRCPQTGGTPDRGLPLCRRSRARAASPRGTARRYLVGAVLSPRDRHDQGRTGPMGRGSVTSRGWMAMNRRVHDDGNEPAHQGVFAWLDRARGRTGSVWTWRNRAWDAALKRATPSGRRGQRSTSARSFWTWGRRGGIRRPGARAPRRPSAPAPTSTGFDVLPISAARGLNARRPGGGGGGAGPGRRRLPSGRASSRSDVRVRKGCVHRRSVDPRGPRRGGRGCSRSRAAHPRCGSAMGSARRSRRGDWRKLGSPPSRGTMRVRPGRPRPRCRRPKGRGCRGSRGGRTRCCSTSPRRGRITPRPLDPSSRG